MGLNQSDLGEQPAPPGGPEATGESLSEAHEGPSAPPTMDSSDSESEEEIKVSGKTHCLRAALDPRRRYDDATLLEAALSLLPGVSKKRLISYHATLDAMYDTLEELNSSLKDDDVFLQEACQMLMWEHYKHTVWLGQEAELKRAIEREGLGSFYSSRQPPCITFRFFYKVITQESDTVIADHGLSVKACSEDYLISDKELLATALSLLPNFSVKILENYQAARIFVLQKMEAWSGSESDSSEAENLDPVIINDTAQAMMWKSYMRTFWRNDETGLMKAISEEGPLQFYVYRQPCGVSFPYFFNATKSFD